MTFYKVPYLPTRLHTTVALLSSNKVLFTVIHLNRLRWLVEIDFYYLWTTSNKIFWLLYVLVVIEVLKVDGNEKRGGSGRSSVADP